MDIDYPYKQVKLFFYVNFFFFKDRLSHKASTQPAVRTHPLVDHLIHGSLNLFLFLHLEGIHHGLDGHTLVEQGNMYCKNAMPS